MGRHNSPLQSELPALHPARCIVVPQRAEFYELGFTFVREVRLQSGVKALCEHREVLLIVEPVGVLEPCWRKNETRKQVEEKISSLPSAYARALAVTISPP